MTALSSITHNGGQSYGITSMLRRERFVQTDGSVEEVPVISGNGIRGMLRDKGMYHMCRLSATASTRRRARCRACRCLHTTFSFWWRPEQGGRQGAQH